MSVVGGLFSDVFKSQGMTVPGSEGSIDWSKAGGNPADLNWAAIKPFEVISPMSWAQTNKDATASEEAKAKLDSIDSTDTRSEYQKWLDGQNGKQDTSHDNKAGPSWYDTTTPEQRAQFFTENPTMAKISELGMNAWQAINPYGLASMQEKNSPGLFSQYVNETRGLAPSTIQEMVNQYSMYNNPDAGISNSGSSFAGYAPSPNENMSVADQYSSYGAGRDTSGGSGGFSDAGGLGQAANDSLSSMGI
jgi:hypothetical protein